jgi:hypothetical protein
MAGVHFFPRKVSVTRHQVRVTTALGADATPSNAGPHSPLPPRPSGGAGGMLRCAGRLWPPRPPAALWSRRARRAAARRPLPARPSTPRRVAREAAGDGRARGMPAALSPGHGATYGPAPSAESARPDEPADDDTPTAAPSRQRPCSPQAGAACHWPAPCPTPTGAASATCRVHAGRKGPSAHGAQPMQRGRGRRSWPKRAARAALFVRSTAERKPQREVWACGSRSGRQKVSTQGAIQGGKRGRPWSKLSGATCHSASHGCLRVAYRASIFMLLPCLAYGPRMHGGHPYTKTWHKAIQVRQSK